MIQLGTEVCDVIEIAKRRGNCICSRALLASGRLLLPAYLYKQISLLASVTADQGCSKSSGFIELLVFFQLRSQSQILTITLPVTSKSVCSLPECLFECQQTTLRARLTLLLVPLPCCDAAVFVWSKPALASLAGFVPYVTDLGLWQQHRNVAVLTWSE